MARKSRKSLIDELNGLSNCTLGNMESEINKYWDEKFSEYPSLKINHFKGAVHAGEFSISDFKDNGKDTIFPRLSLKFDNDVKPRTTSSYCIVVDGHVAKIGALTKGVKDSSFAQYLSGISGSPSRRSCGVYTFINAMLKLGRKVEVYHVTMDGAVNVTIPTINGNVKGLIHYSPRDIEKTNVEQYKSENDGYAPYLNLKERGATYPKVFDNLYDLVNRRINLTKQYKD